MKGRGSLNNPNNKFAKHKTEAFDDGWYFRDEDEPTTNKTRFIEVFPKTIVNEVKSREVPFSYSMNPYQGCEHGCTYCYARNSHEYWGYSAGVDFEQTILVKKDAPKLLEELFNKKNWKANSILLSGNTDCYQPCERKFEITRQCLEVFLKYQHPVNMITKNALIIRDLDILQQLAEKNLVSVAVSITTLDADLRRNLEPRTATAKQRLMVVEKLAQNNIPVIVLAAPIIPGLNSEEIPAIIKAANNAGAYNIYMNLVRLNGQIAQIFTDWITEHYPLKAERVINMIKAIHGGELGDPEFNRILKGEGNIAEQIRQLFNISKKKFFKEKILPEVDLSLYEKIKHSQLKLF